MRLECIPGRGESLLVPILELAKVRPLHLHPGPLGARLFSPGQPCLGGRAGCSRVGVRQGSRPFDPPAAWRTCRPMPRAGLSGTPARKPLARYRPDLYAGQNAIEVVLPDLDRRPPRGPQGRFDRPLDPHHRTLLSPPAPLPPSGVFHVRLRGTDTGRELRVHDSGLAIRAAALPSSTTRINAIV